MAIRSIVPKFMRRRGSVPVRAGEYDPFRDFQREMNRMFDEFFGDYLPAFRLEGRGDLQPAFSPNVDVVENDKEVIVSAELPGIDEKDVTVEIDDVALTIRGEKKEEKEDKGKNWYHKELAYGSFNRVIPLPVEVDKDKAKAKFKKGVLKVILPKTENAKKNQKTISVESE